MGEPDRLSLLKVGIGRDDGVEVLLGPGEDRRLHLADQAGEERNFAQKKEPLVVNTVA